MESRLYQSGVFALYQLSLLIGILMLPVSLAAKRVGVPPLPMHRVVTRLHEAHEADERAGHN